MLRKFPANIKRYMCRLYTTGWVTPAVVIVPLLAPKKYGNIVIHVDDGSSANMSWIPDSAIHLGLNIGFYAIVFIFTSAIFSMNVVQIVRSESTAVEVQDSSPIKKKFLSILGLFCLLGIFWGFAFFSFGPLLIPSFLRLHHPQLLSR
ncbi:G-protein coupled receptor 56-like [Nothobranchius furzeri]|uniref:G-protein coupled receptor 56-like n=1 Tax=Nothobranchius furzeri TaxID=105023 RepID=A0A9D3BBA5_NOTFU|nr:G-protein coupled receptor 56-like [Nothobranchius furzeri]